MVKKLDAIKFYAIAESGNTVPAIPVGWESGEEDYGVTLSW